MCRRDPARSGGHLVQLGRVIGTVTATVKHPYYVGRALMVVAVLRPDGTPTGKETLAVDTVGAGVGDHVLILKEGNSAKAIFGEWGPLQEMIVGVVDHVEMASARGEGVTDVSR